MAKAPSAVGSALPVRPIQGAAPSDAVRNPACGASAVSDAARKGVILFSLSDGIASGGTAMTKVTVNTKILAPAEEVWRLVGGWNALPDWHPAVETSVIEDGGHRRRLKLADGGEIIEQLEKFDGEAKTYTYSVVGGTMPFSDYRSTITVCREGEKSTIEWSTSFRPMGVPENELSRTLEQFYQTGFDNLRKLLGT
jgi:uncharacterized protein YndB with AHSA1/START domain